MYISKIENILVEHLHYAKLTGYVRNYKFDTKRRYTFDFAWLVPKLAVEVEGGTRRFKNRYSGTIVQAGRHTQSSGYESDCRKYNLAQIQGWKVLRFSSSQVMTGEALLTIEAALGLEEQVDKYYKLISARMMK